MRNPRQDTGPRLLFSIYILFTLGLILLGVVAYQAQREQLHAGAEAQLRSVAQLRMSQIQAWLGERRADLSYASQGSVIAENFAAWLASGGNDEAKAVRIRQRMEDLRKAYGYENFALFDSDGRFRLSQHADPAATEHGADARRVLALGKPVLVDVHDHGAAAGMMAMAVPMMRGYAGTGANGVLLAAIPASSRLYPLIARWPGAGGSGETLLVHREAAGLRTIFASRETQPGPRPLLGDAMSRFLTTHAEPGWHGRIPNTVDHRGISVLAYATAIPDTPWFLITKVDMAEVDAPLNHAALGIAVATLLLLAVSGLALRLWWRGEAGLQESRLLAIELERSARERESVQSYRTLADSGQALVWAAGLDKGCDYFNQVWLDFTGRTLEQERGGGWTEGVHPDDLKRCMDTYISAFDRREKFSMEYRLRRKDGRYRWILDDGSPRFNAQGEFIGYLGHCLDITERKQSELLLRARLRFSELANQQDLDSVMREALDLAESLTESSIGFFHFVDANQESLTLQAWSSNTLRNMCKAEGKGMHYPVSQAGVWADAVRTRQIVIHNDYAGLVDRKGLPPGHAHIIRELVVPLLRGDRVTAVLGVGNKALAYDEADGRLAQQLAAMAMDFVDRKRAEDALRASEEHYRLIAENVSDVIWLMDRATMRLTYVSPSVERLLGFTPAEMMARDIDATLGPETASLIRSRGQVEKVTAGEKTGADTLQTLQVELAHREGHLIHAEIAMRCLRDTGGQAHTVLGVTRDITDRRIAQDRLDQARNYDGLTGLPNSRWLMRELRETMARLAVEPGRMALLVLNLDRFAQLNETLGRALGDAVLNDVAQRWRDILPENCHLARLEADQFAVLSNRGEDAQQTLEIASAVTRCLENPIQFGDDRRVALTVSVGIALYPGDADDAAALLHAAEDAMREAKAEKGNRVRFFDRQHAQMTIDWFETENALRQALEQDEFFLVYQPQVRASSGQVESVEALLRWRRNGEVVPPGRFIRVVEGTDLALPVSRWVLATACKQAKGWLDRGLALRVAVNVFSDHVTSGQLIDDVARALATSDLPARWLELEVVESSLFANPDLAAQTLRQLKELGVALALDDFGTGYSSLGYLKNYPFDVLKIDQLFARNVNRDAEDAAIVRSTISLGHNLGMRVLAEGIETTPQLRFMARYGCDMLQGYLMSRPVPADELAALLAKRPDLRPDGATDGEHARGILVVEDEPLEAELLAMDLENEGYRVYLCEDMEGALGILDRERIDLVLSDHYLRGETTGVQLLRKLLRLFPDIPRVMMSGTEDKSVVVDAVNQAGIRAFLPKPIDPESLRDTLAAILREGEVSAPGFALLLKEA